MRLANVFTMLATKKRSTSYLHVMKLRLFVSETENQG
jgi:hypothetical protein